MTTADLKNECMYLYEKRCFDTGQLRTADNNGFKIEKPQVRTTELQHTIQ
jgi:hypothetical protein